MINDRLIRQQKILQDLIYNEVSDYVNVDPFDTKNSGNKLQKKLEFVYLINIVSVIDQEYSFD